MVNQEGAVPMLYAEQRRVLRGMALALIVAFLVLGLGAFLAWPLMPVLPRLEDRLAFTLRCDLFEPPPGDQLRLL